MTDETTDLTEEFVVSLIERELRRIRGLVEKGISESEILFKDMHTFPWDKDRALQAVHEFREIQYKIGDALDLAHDRFTP